MQILRDESCFCIPIKKRCLFLICCYMKYALVTRILLYKKINNEKRDFVQYIINYGNRNVFQLNSAISCSVSVTTCTFHFINMNMQCFRLKYIKHTTSKRKNVSVTPIYFISHCWATFDVRSETGSFLRKWNPIWVQVLSRWILPRGRLSDAYIWLLHEYQTVKWLIIQKFPIHFGAFWR